MEKLNSTDAVTAGLHARSGHDAHLEVHGRYTAVCYDARGVEKWRENFDNLVTTAGKNDLLDKYLGNTASGTLYLGLKGSGAAAAADTQGAHSGWAEVGGANAPAYSGTRKTPAFSAASAGSKTTSTAVSFAFTSGGTVAGAFLNSGGTSAQDNTTGVLYSAGDFATARTVASGDTLAVTYQASV